jgi:hypothetical protein
LVHLSDFERSVQVVGPPYDPREWRAFLRSRQVGGEVIDGEAVAVSAVLAREGEVL